MGRITIFSTSECPHCNRAKGALILRKIPFVEIDVQDNPLRRNDMLQLSDSLTVPQVFFNQKHVGGADELVQLLKGWDDDISETSSFDHYVNEVGSLDDPSDERLAEPEKEAEGASTRRPSNIVQGREASISLPDGFSTVVEMTLKLDAIFDQQDRPWNAHCYKSCFVNTEAISALQEHFNLPDRKAAVCFGKYLQEEHNMFHHVCGEHNFQDGGILFFRLQRYQQPDVLNSFCVWDRPVNSKSANDILFRLKKLQSGIINSSSGLDGLVDYIRAQQHEDFPRFEEATCALQRMDISLLEENMRKAFCLNLYNIFITYAFIKLGIGTTGLARGAFFSKTKMNIGGNLLSFDELEHGILRGNTKHPFAMRESFLKGDTRLDLALERLDPRIHFALNCGAKSCPPVKYFHKESLEEELRIVALSFCEQDDVVSIDEEKNEITVSMLFKWYEKDFCCGKEKLPTVLQAFVRGKKKEALIRMIEKAQRKKKHISIKYHAYDWNANASRFVSYKASNLKANEFSATALLQRNSCASVV